MKPQVNLLPKYERYSNLSSILFMIFLLIFLILAIVLTFFFFQERKTLQEAEDEIIILEEERTLLEMQLENVSDADKPTLRDAVLFAESHAVPVSKLIDELVTLLPEHSYIVDYEYTYDTATMEVHFETMTATANYMESLTNSRFLTNAQIDNVNTVDPDTGLTDEEEAPQVIFDGYDIIPRYQATYSLDVNQEELMKEEEGNE